MSDHNRQTNPLLLIIVILLCLSSGFFLRQSSYDPDYFTKESVTSRESNKASSAKDSKEKNTTQNSDKKKTSKKAPSVTPKRLRNRPKHRLFLTTVTFPRKHPKVLGLQAEVTGCFWLTDSLTPDGLPTQIIRNIISTKTESCRLVGSM